MTQSMLTFRHPERGCFMENRQYGLGTEEAIIILRNEEHPTVSTIPFRPKGKFIFYFFKPITFPFDHFLSNSSLSLLYLFSISSFFLTKVVKSTFFSLQTLPSMTGEQMDIAGSTMGPQNYQEVIQ